MAALITLDEAKRELEVEHLEDDAAIQRKAEAATEIVIDYIKRPDHTWTHADVPFLIYAAIILVLKSLYDDREKAEMLRGLAGGDLSNPVVSILYRYRDPALA